jgi:E3 ubiquitin-protein ligase TM129
MQIKSVRPGVRHFAIRFKSDSFLLLKDRIHGRIEILSSAKFHTSLVDHFVEVFKEQVAKNPKFQFNGELIPKKYDTDILKFN